MLRAAYLLPDTPLHVEHEAQKDPIGKIVSADVNDKDELVVVGEISRLTLRGAEMINRLRKGDIKGLSLGTTHDVFVGKGMTPLVLDKRITEVSVVKEPGLEGTYVEEIGPDSEGFSLSRQLVDERVRRHNLEKKLHIERTRLNKQAPQGKSAMASSSKEESAASAAAAAAAAPSSSTESSSGELPDRIDIKSVMEANALRQKRRADQSTEELQETELDEKVKKEIQRQHADLIAANAELTEKLELFKKLKMDPKDALDFVQSEVQKKSDEVASLLDASKDFVAEVYQGAGIRQDKRFMDTLDACRQDPIAAEPLAQFVAAASASHGNTIKRMEGQYESLKEKHAAEQKRADEAEKRLKEQEKVLGYRGFVTGSASGAAASSGSGKKKDGAVKSDPTLGLFGSHKSSTEEYWSQAPPNMGAVMSASSGFADSIAPPRAGMGIFRTRREDQQPLVALLREGAKKQSSGGMPVFDFKRFLGRDVGQFSDQDAQLVPVTYETQV